MKRGTERARRQQSEQGKAAHADNQSSAQAGASEPNVPWMERVSYEDDEETDAETHSSADEDGGSEAGSRTQRDAKDQLRSGEDEKECEASRRQSGRRGSDEQGEAATII